MKKIILGAVILILMNTSKLLAQNGGGGGRMQQAMQSYLKDSVQLSDAMTDSVMDINKQYQPQMRDIFMDQSASAADKQTKMQGLRSEVEARYKSAGLTDAQIQQIHQHQEMMMNRMRNRAENGSGNQ